MEPSVDLGLRPDRCSQGRGHPLLVCNQDGHCLDEDAPALGPAAPLSPVPGISSVLFSEAASSSHPVAAVPPLPDLDAVLPGRVSDGIVPDEVSLDSASASIPPSVRCPVLSVSGDGGASSSGNQVLVKLSCPVHVACSERTVGPCSASSGAPKVPASPLPCHSNFEFASSMFPPLQSNSAHLENTTPAQPLDLHGVSCDLNVAKGKHPPDWASLLKETPSSMQLKFIKPVIISSEGKVTIKLPSSVALQGSSIWKNTMVGFFLDNLPFSLVQATAMKHWGKLGLLNVLSNGNGFFFFNFPCSDNLNVALEGGPWHFGGRPIFLKRWSPCMNLTKEGCRKVPIWANFFNVPLEFWTEDGLSYIASMVGKPLHADNMTSSRRRLSYARVCIEIDIDDSLPDAFDIELDDGSVAGIQVAYNWIPKRCSICKVFGHLPSNCKKPGQKVWIPKSANPNSLPLRDGDWKNVASNRKVVPVNLSRSPKAMHASASMTPELPISNALPLKGLQSSVNPFAALRSVEEESAKGSHEEPAPDGEPNDAVADPIHVEDPSGSGVRDPISAADPIAVGYENPIAPDDPIATGARDPLAFDDPNAMLQELGVYSSVSSVSPHEDRSGSSLHPVVSYPNSNDHLGTSPPSSSPPSTPLLARKLIMIDEVEMKLGRKKKKDKKLAACSGLSRGLLSKSSK